MAHYEITKVKVARAEAGHEHVVAVELNGSANFRLSREEVVADMEDPEGDRYDVRVGEATAAVVVAACPHCGAGGHLTTDGAGGDGNLLLTLPRFYWLA